MRNGIVLLLFLVQCLAMVQNVSPAEPEKPVFQCDNGSLGVGMDKKVYVGSKNMLIQCNPNGSQPVGLPLVNPSIVNAAVNPHGIIAVANGHFAKSVILLDQEFNVIGKFDRIAGMNFRSPAGIATGPSGDFYVLDQYRDQVIRFHPDGIRCGIYQIPREPAGPNGELCRFRVCEKTKRIYVAGRPPSIRCYSFDASEWKFTCERLWEVKTGGSLEGGSSWIWGYGGFDVDDNGVLYVMEQSGDIQGPSTVKRYDRDGQPLKDIALTMAPEFRPSPGKYMDLCVANNEIFIKRSHATEMYQRYDLATGLRKSVVSMPPDYAAIVRVPKNPDAGLLIKPVQSKVGIPPGRKTIRVLFVGNSQFNCIGDIPDIVEELSRSVSDPDIPLILASEIIFGGVGLEGYWNTGIPQKRIAAGGWDWIVVNEILYSFGGTTAKFQEYARKFSREAQKTGARVLFVATGESEKAKNQAEVMYQDAVAMAKEVNGRVAGAGMSWVKAWARDRKLDFWHTDRAHPSARGYYINACVIFAALSDCSPVGLSPYAELSLFPEGKDNSDRTDKTALQDEITLLQQAAWEQYQEDRQNDKVPAEGRQRVP